MFTIASQHTLSVLKSGEINKHFSLIRPNAYVRAKSIMLCYVNYRVPVEGKIISKVTARHVD